MDLESAQIEPHQLPAEVTVGLQTLMASFGLVYGAMDLRLTADGDYVFLEGEGSPGQWLFVELRTSQPITATMARYLSAHDRKR